MAETDRIWVRTSTLDIAIYGKVKSSTQRTIPGAAIDDTPHHWGWSRGRIVHDNEEVRSDAEEKLEYTAEEEITVLIQDGESAHNRKEVVLKGSSFQNGDVVMDNVYGNDQALDHGDDVSSVHDDYYASDEDDAKNDKYPDDLIILTHLHEASVLYCLRKRYAMNKIYTSTGPILIAMNPFKNCKQLYSEITMKKYWERGERRMLGVTNVSPSLSGDGRAQRKASPSPVDDSDDNLSPHVYSLADDSFRKMMGKLEEIKSETSSGGRRRRAPPASPSASPVSSSCNQSILVSGESGAGKTVTTKFIMQYLATLSKRRALSTSTAGKEGGQKVDMEQQVLQSNPILESFGNARTIRNDNSSRFGKFIEIQFTDKGHLAGACVETYLLEKVRLVSQMEGERNYHIFYEMMEGLSDEELDQYFLSDYGIDDFLMTNQSGTYDRRDGVSDYETYQDLLVAMDTMGFSSEEQKGIMTIACALLHSSNLSFNSITADESEIDRENGHLEAFLSLMGLTAEGLNRALCYFSITAGRETHLRSLSQEKALKGLLALIKTVYGALFTYIVKRVNESIAIFHSKNKGDKGGSAAAASIGVLDIFGFESFETNSFEQLCINYCNETLQQQFNIFVLKNEQEEYEREGIKWSYVSFPDNNDVLTLISKKGAGILSILDDQCRAPGTTDKTFINDLYQKVSRQKRFQADYRQVGASKFAIIHYAGIVEYSSEGFVEKNRDELPREAAELLLSSSNKFLRGLAEIISGPVLSSKDPKKKNMVRSKAKSTTVGGQFTRQLQELRQKIDLTTPHYVRCLKPNDELVPDNFDPLIVADQLRCAGVVEAVRVSRLGYPQRYSHTRFVSRYCLLGQKASMKENGTSRRRKPVEVLVEAIAEKINRISSKGRESDETERMEPDLVAIGIQVGKTKVFLRRSAFETIERLRNLEMRDAAISLQAFTRRCIAHERFALSKRASITLQCFIRKVTACRVVNERRRNFNAIMIQTAIRKVSARQRYLSVLFFCKVLQSLHRGNVGRKCYQAMKREHKATVIQKTWKMFQVKNSYTDMRFAAITIQCAMRSAKARTKSKIVKKAARDLRNTVQERDQFREENKTLEKKLADTLAKLVEANASLNDDNMEKELKACESKVADLQRELKEAQDSISEGEIRATEAETGLRKGLQQQYSVQEKGMRAQISQLEELYQLKEKETVQCRNDIEILKEELKLALSSNAELLENEEKINVDIESLRDENASLQKVFSSTKNELDSLTEEVSHIKQSAASSASELASVKAGKEELVEKVSEQRQQIKTMEEIKVEKEELILEMANIRQEVGIVNGDLITLRNERESLKRSLESTTEDLNQSKIEAMHLKQAIESSQKATKSFTTALAVSKKENEKLSRNIHEQDHEIKALSIVRVERDELSGEKSRLHEELDRLVNGDLVSLRKENSLSEENLSRVRKERDEAKSEVLDLSQAIVSGKTKTDESSVQSIAAETEKQSLSESIRTQEQQIEIIDKKNKLLSDEVKTLRVELDSSITQVGNLEREKTTLEDALENARNELQKSQTEVTLLQENTDTLTIEVARIQAENDRLLEKTHEQEQQVEAMSTIEVEREKLLEEVAKLREDLISAKAANDQLRAIKEKLSDEKLVKKPVEFKAVAQSIPERIQGLEHSNSNEMNAISVKDSDLTSEEEPTISLEGDKDTEIVNLKEIISSLKAELKAAPQSNPARESDSQYNDANLSRLQLEETKTTSAQEILTLQDEVERLNQEISSTKSIGQSSNAPVTNTQTSKLIDSIMAKDEEIRDLRREIAILRDQLDSTTMSMLTESQSHFQSRIVDDDDRSVMSKIFGRSQQQRTSPSVKGIDSKEVIQLRSLNESLRSELETAKRERDELESTLTAEQEKSSRELEAFAGALEGVDGLRRAAEQMSREITRLKNQKDDEVPEDPFDDISRDAVKDLENGIENFVHAKRKIGNASLKSEQKGLWGRLRLNVRSLQNEGGSQNSARSKGRDKENDDSSIFSSFF